MLHRHLGSALLLVSLGCSAKAPESDALAGPDPSAGAGGTTVPSAPAGAGGSGEAGSTATSGQSGTQALPTAGSGSGGAGSAGSDAPDPGAAGSGAAGAGGTESTMPRGTGPGDWVAGDYPPGLEEANFLELSGVPGQGENVRQYKVHLPPSYDPAVPTPTVFCIHGLGQDALLFCISGAAMPAKSDQEGFVLIMPNGYQNSWNAGTCCGGASSEQLDDVALFRAIFEEVGKHVNIDLDRVYATGLSNGGYMSYRLACEAADIFTAVAPGAGAVGINDIGGGTNSASDFTTCTPSQPVSVLDIHGTADPLIPYSLQAPSLMLLATTYGCGTTTEPAALPASSGDTTCVHQTGCPAGIELVGCTIEAGGHCWFGSPDCGTGGGDIGLAIVGANSDTMINTDAVWSFFEQSAR